MNVPALPPYLPSAGVPGTPTEGMVLVAVPLAYVPHVARLLADLDARQRVAPVPRRRVDPVSRPPESDWTVADLRRLSQGRSATHRTVAAVLDALASEPERLFTVGELAETTGRPRKKIVGAMAGLTRLLKAHYDYAGRGFPFDRVPGRPEAPRELCYTMDRARAARWREARLPASEADTRAGPPVDPAERREEQGADRRTGRGTGDRAAEGPVACSDA
ncbi:hypothetical protein O7605_27390 [Verrucosispora sp. WMMA2121]|uniref:hypothetical protein n=1 Tax=Verrucosispora sp. WMMA2121 TaxID=3015164 RepID=UPI0022B6F41A|nr:hypothetical protein [Verrucosispora sp. WMMA2121]MCZ7423235.1 hypothetical protein [Verrucosispora sp. WMMA2121]